MTKNDAKKILDSLVAFRILDKYEEFTRTQPGGKISKRTLRRAAQNPTEKLSPRQVLAVQYAYEFYNSIQPAQQAQVV